MDNLNNIDVDSLMKNVEGLKSGFKDILNKVTTPEVLSKMNGKQRDILKKAEDVLNKDIGSEDMVESLEDVINLIKK